MLQTEAEREDVAREIRLMEVMKGKSDHVVTLHQAFESPENVSLVLELSTLFTCRDSARFLL